MSNYKDIDQLVKNFEAHLLARGFDPQTTSNRCKTVKSFCDHVNKKKSEEKKSKKKKSEGKKSKDWRSELQNKKLLQSFLDTRDESLLSRDEKKAHVEEFQLYLESIGPLDKVVAILERFNQRAAIKLFLAIITTILTIVGVINIYILPKDLREAQVSYDSSPTTTSSVTPTASHTPTPSSTPTPTPTQVNRSGYDISIGVAAFLPDPNPICVDSDESEDELWRLTNNIAFQIREDMTNIEDQASLSLPNTDDQGSLSWIVDDPEQIVVYHSTVVSDIFSARELAINAGYDIIVYGTVCQHGNGSYTLTPSFYVNPNNFSEALEIVGLYRFGNDVPTALQGSDFNAVRIASEEEVEIRTLALAHTFLGLISYGERNYLSAQNSFEEAASIIGNREGIEVLQVLIGNAYLLQATDLQLRDPVGNREEMRILIAFAEKNFLNAYSISFKEYARACTGLASTYIYKAGRIFFDISRVRVSETDVLLALWSQVDRYLTAAANFLACSEHANDQPQEGSVDKKRDLISAQLMLLTWSLEMSLESESTIDLDIARNILSSIIGEYTGSSLRGDNTVRGLAGSAYFLDGRILFIQGNKCDARRSFDMALGIFISMGDRRNQIMTYAARAETLWSLGDIQGAVQDYENAIDLARDEDYSYLIGLYENAIDLATSEIQPTLQECSYAN